MTEVVVDLGCQDYGFQDSLASLAETYKPKRIYGFDPSPLLVEGTSRMNGATVKLERKAAWLFDGEIAFDGSGTLTRIDAGDQTVSCFDLSKWLKKLNKQVVLKMDVEGAEYALLERLVEDGTIRYVDELIVEWHGDGPTAPLLEQLECEVTPWWM